MNGDTLIDTALEDSTDMCIVFLICLNRKIYIVSDAADSFKTFQGMMWPFFKDFIVDLLTK